jgi:hypothetical protein
VAAAQLSSRGSKAFTWYSSGPSTGTISYHSSSVGRSTDKTGGSTPSIDSLTLFRNVETPSQIDFSVFPIAGSPVPAPPVHASPYNNTRSQRSKIGSSASGVYTSLVDVARMR